MDSARTPNLMLRVGLGPGDSVNHDVTIHQPVLSNVDVSEIMSDGKSIDQAAQIPVGGICVAFVPREGGGVDVPPVPPVLPRRLATRGDAMAHEGFDHLGILISLPVGHS